MVEMTVARLGLDSATDSYVVILRERDGRRLLPIWIGKPEAESILMQMNQVKRERPLTHDLCKALIVSLGGALRRVTISRVESSTYFAELHIEGAAGWIQVDARPSDSIAIALRLDAPIFAEANLLTNIDDDDADDSDASAPGFILSVPKGELTSAQLQAYLANLQPEDFGKFSP
ncbi:MAG: bifunctional nuclease family protein [Gemmatimonadaceae bacterium]|jgi:bifunctional DNase/RNase|nr:bifunctional nuclease family protein [Gemmatimonadaceae bacterium]MCC6429666.1 bifunctional nuclease family protein [Gemmatimonadaceae bacterium]